MLQRLLQNSGAGWPLPKGSSLCNCRQKLGVSCSSRTRASGSTSLSPPCSTSQLRARSIQPLM